MSGAVLLVFGRCAGFASRAPGFSHPSVPRPVRAGFGLALAVALSPAATHLRAPEGIRLALAVAFEVGIGAAIGTAASILYDGAYAGGRALDDYVGIRGSVPNAQFFASSAFGRIWSLVFTAGFFLLGGYRYAIGALASSFDRLPPGGAISMHGLYAFAIGLPVQIVDAALTVAGPAIALVFVAQLTLGALTRVIPRFATFALSFPIVFAVALTATLLAIPLLFQASGVPWISLPFLEKR